jgi:C1A family cysteine protease
MSDWEFTYPNVYPWFYLDLNSDGAVQTMKNLLADGYLITLSIQADCYEQLSDNDVWNTLNYATNTSNHANTIIGYDDSMR